MNQIRERVSLKLFFLVISGLLVGCSSTQQSAVWQYNANEQSLNAPEPFSAYVYVTQQIQNGQLNYVTCNPKLCPIKQRKTAE